MSRRCRSLAGRFNEPRRSRLHINLADVIKDLPSAFDRDHVSNRFYERLTSLPAAQRRATFGVKTMSEKIAPQDTSADHLVVFQEKAIRRLWNDQE